ncbi:hypothetical protein [Micromonospora sp. NPDC005197]|uniref:hypothetical protein n=1 Tax=Micromonospora sp. NPDC005197 TaxID=3157020 RepID=UPI0033A425E8
MVFADPGGVPAEDGSAGADDRAGADGFASGTSRWQYSSTAATPPAASTSRWKAGVRNFFSRFSGFPARQARHSPCS